MGLREEGGRGGRGSEGGRWSAAVVGLRREVA